MSLGGAFSSTGGGNGASAGGAAPTSSGRARLYVRGSGNEEDSLTFPLNPHLSYSVRSNYAETGVAYDDMTGSGPAPFEWTRNAPTELTIEATFHESEDRDVQKYLDRIGKFQRKNPKTGEPPDLSFKYGRRSWVCRLESHRVREKLWTADLRVQWADVTLMLKVLRQG